MDSTKNTSAPAEALLTLKEVITAIISAAEIKGKGDCIIHGGIDKDGGKSTRVFVSVKSCLDGRHCDINGGAEISPA